MDYAPVVIFVYNRLEHTKKTISSLLDNALAKYSDVFIFSDGPKNVEDEVKVNKVRSYIKSVNGFNRSTIIQREKNWGLAQNIIDGVTQVVTKYSKIIVLEDDLIVSPGFLKFMNDALDYYQPVNKVWHISGWNYSIDGTELSDVFLWRVMNCWGWGTWSDRWSKFEWNVDNVTKDFTSSEIKMFNLDGTENFWAQVIANKQGKLDTWAIYWYATIFKNHGLCLNPTQTFVQNIGHDGSGVHSGKTDYYSSGLNYKKEFLFEDKFVENQIAVQRIKKFYRSIKKPLYVRGINKILELFRHKTSI